MHTARQLHTATVPDSRTLLQALPSIPALRSAALSRAYCPDNCIIPAHYHTLLHALMPHTATCTVARIHALPHTFVRTATKCRTLPHAALALPHTTACTPAHIRTQPHTSARIAQHCRTLPQALPNIHGLTAAHCLVYCRTHPRTAARIRAHCRTLPLMPRTVAHCHTLPRTLPHAAAHTTTHCHPPPHCCRTAVALPRTATPQQSAQLCPAVW
jgi:hypothetical protein